MPRPLPDLTGQRFGRLTVLSYAGIVKGGNGATKSTWNVRCDCGTVAVVAHGNLANRNQSCGCARFDARHGGRRRYALSYSGMHRRVRVERGSAKRQRCVDCDGRAYEWSYDHTDPDECEEVVRGYLVTYSLDAAYYTPRCKSCHVRYDKARKRAAA
jgi:hypothetical protein